MSGRQAFFIQKILEPIAMGILKAFIGGLVGAMIATVVLMVLRDGSLRGYEWFPLVTGLLTGLGCSSAGWKHGAEPRNRDRRSCDCHAGDFVG